MYPVEYPTKSLFSMVHQFADLPTWPCGNPCLGTGIWRLCMENQWNSSTNGGSSSLDPAVDQMKNISLELKIGSSWIIYRWFPLWKKILISSKIRIEVAAGHGGHNGCVRHSQILHTCPRLVGLEASEKRKIALAMENPRVNGGWMGNSWNLAYNSGITRYVQGEHGSNNLNLW